MVEDRSENLLSVLPDCDVAPDRTPETCSVARDDSHLLRVDVKDIDRKPEIFQQGRISFFNLFEDVVLLLEVRGSGYLNVLDVVAAGVHLTSDLAVSVNKES